MPLEIVMKKFETNYRYHTPLSEVIVGILHSGNTRPNGFSHSSLTNFSRIRYQEMESRGTDLKETIIGQQRGVCLLASLIIFLEEGLRHA